MLSRYTSFQHLLQVYDNISARYAFKAEYLSQYRLWKKKLRVKLADITGLNQMTFSELKPEVLETEKMDDYKRIKMIIQTEPAVLMPFYILLPDDLQEGEERAAVIAPHGHDSGGKYAVAGRSDIPGVNRVIEKYNYDYGIQLVKKGYIVFCPDARGFGERREIIKQGDEGEDILSSSCHELNNLAIALGQSLTGMFVWDLMRLLDYAETCQYVDSTRIAVCGFSGGGLQALWLAVMDQRVKAAIVAGYFHGFKDTIFQSNMCSCNFVPQLWRYCDMGDLGAMIAPRPLMIKSGSKDKLNGNSGLANVYSQLEIVRSAYKLMNAEGNLYHHVFNGGHIWNGDRVDEFLKSAFS
ncbi:hypothetical protein GM661_04540 [Iocasia frigidifontis]|uniref:Abhydrolase family protein n=1 Tax=Iocasia fonsfrigidae TaxID=2682810 RepID=A0A8A7K7A9_9FIRM|nr:hypothetical protein GM661_04540 [Iocasia fonsfrigidae]